MAFRIHCAIDGLLNGCQIERGKRIEECAIGERTFVNYHFSEHFFSRPVITFYRVFQKYAPNLKMQRKNTQKLLYDRSARNFSVTLCF